MTAMSRSLLPERIALLLPSWRMVSVVFGGFASALVVLTAGHVVATPLVTIAALCLGGCVAYMLRARSPQALIVLGHAFAALCAVVAACSDEIAHVPTGIALAGITVHILVVIALTLWRRYGAVTTIARAVSYATLGAGLGFAWFAVHADIRCAPCQTAMAGLAITAVGWWRGRERGAGTTLSTALAVGGYMLSGALLVVTTILMDPWQTRSQEERFIIAYLEELQRTGTRLDQGRFIASWRARQGDGGIAIGSVDADYDLELLHRRVDITPVERSVPPGAEDPRRRWNGSCRPAPHPGAGCGARAPMRRNRRRNPESRVVVRGHRHLHCGLLHRSRS